MDARQERGIEIATYLKIRKSNDGWIVPSQTLKGAYRVTIGDNGPHCTCPDHELRQKPCKHMFAVQFFLKQETNEHGETTVTSAVRVSYTQDWPAYNAAQTTEKATFTQLLHDLCADLPTLPQDKGRPRLPLSDMVFAATFKTYSTFSGRRFMTDLREACSKGFISHTPHFNSIFNYLELVELTPILQGLITRSALPLKAIETDFAIDSTGFTTTQLVGLWQAEKYGGSRLRMEHDWLKVHAMTGAKTNVVVALEITPRNTQDSPYFKPLLESTAQNFNVQRVLGDKAYSSFANLELTEAKGATPFIPFKSYAVAAGKCATWDKLLGFYLMHREEFLKAYHQRSNAESYVLGY